MMAGMLQESFIKLPFIKLPRSSYVVQKLYEDHNWQFWFLQLLGWTGYSFITFVAFTLWDDNVSLSHVGHTALQALLGILSSWPLRRFYRWMLDFPALTRAALSTIAVLSLSWVWTALRLVTFMWISGERGLWLEFNNWYFGSLFVFMSWTALYFGIKYYQLLLLEHQKLLEEGAHTREEHVKRLQAESSARDAQLQMLRYQLNPHFLFNTLNAINALVKLEENQKAQDMLQHLSRFLRHSLDQSTIERVSLDEELSTLMLYLDIEKSRFEERLQLDFDIEPQARQALVPSLILQPLIENSMKYAVGVSEDGGSIRVAAHVVRDQLQLEVSDTGPGINQENPGEGPGVGLRNTRQRLEALYGDKYSFETSAATPSGLSIQICLPYEA